MTEIPVFEVEIDVNESVEKIIKRQDDLRAMISLSTELTAALLGAGVPADDVLGARARGLLANTHRPDAIEMLVGMLSVALNMMAEKEKDVDD